MSRVFVSNNKTLISILIYITIFLFFVYIKPSFLYNSNGSLREFGVGYKNKTIMPIWIFSIILGIFSYFAVLLYIYYPRIVY